MKEVLKDREKLIEVQKEIQTKSEIVCVDLSDAQNCIDLYKKVGDIDILINNIKQAQNKAEKCAKKWY